jgi:hypothetical protein
MGRGNRLQKLREFVGLNVNTAITFNNLRERGYGTGVALSVTSWVAVFVTLPLVKDGMPARAVAG